VTTDVSVFFVYSNNNHEHVVILISVQNNTYSGWQSIPVFTITGAFLFQKCTHSWPQPQ